MINSWSVQTAPLERAQRSAALVGCVADNSTKDLIKCLKQKPVNQLIESTSISSLGNSTVATFGPTIEVATAGAFLDDDPYKLLSAGKINDVPWINSYCTADGSVSGKSKYMRILLVCNIHTVCPNISVPNTYWHFNGFAVNILLLLRMQALSPHKQNNPFL